MKLLAAPTILALCFTSFMSNAQPDQDSLTFIQATQNLQYPNVYTFSVANEPPLMQVAGAPKAHYSYFWEFGDGHYSFKPNPTHIYTDSTEKPKKVVISLTNNYGSGGAPRMRQKKVVPKRKKPEPQSLLKKEDMEPSPLSKDESIHLFTNHSPRPGDPMVCVLSYQNTADQLPENGMIHLFFNEKQFSHPHFSFQESRTHHEEVFYEKIPEEVFSMNNSLNNDTNIWASANHAKPAAGNTPMQASAVNTLPYVFYSTKNADSKMVTQSKKLYKNGISWMYRDLQPGEKRNIFTSFLCSPEMRTDTSKTISIRAVVVPENKEKAKEYNLKMVIQSSHDPNKLEVSDRRIKKRFIRRRGITYKVKFRNVGKGPARNIKIVNDLHPSLDPSSIEIIDYYPKAALCLHNDSASYSCLDSTKIGQKITWHFKNVYLPGTRQRDKESRQATKGWIEFSVKPKKQFSRKDIIKGRSLIYFDSNDPIKTNRVRTKVDKNWSFGLKAGFAEMPVNIDHVTLGASFASFRPKGFYLQPEINFSSLSHEGVTREVIGEFILTPDGTEAQGDETTRQSFQLQYLDIIPLQVRKNITPFASIGAGFMVSWLLKAKEVLEIDRTYYPTRENDFQPPYDPYSTRSSSTVYSLFGSNKDERFSSIETGFFLDVQGGLVRKGPCLGLRYQMRSGKRATDVERSEKQSNNTLQVYVKMRF